MHKTTFKIAILPGDGIGVEVLTAALPVFKAFALPLNLEFGEIGWSCWQKEGTPVPDKTWDLLKRSDAALLGAITSKPTREAMQELPAHLQISPPQYVSPIIQLRQKLDLFANVRPCFNIKQDTKAFNFCIIRENTEGLYAGFDYYPLPEYLHELIQLKQSWRHVSRSGASCTLRLQSKKGLQRIFQFAFAYAEQHGFKRVTFADKPNVLHESSAFARILFEEVAQQFPQVTADILNIDAVALWLIRRPEEFGVIVTENMFGDILSDVGAGVMGGLGFSPSANIGETYSYFEPVHGSGLRMRPNAANPSAMFLTISLLLAQLGYHKEAKQIRQAIVRVVMQKQFITYDVGGHATTQEMAAAIIEQAVHSEGI